MVVSADVQHYEEMKELSHRRHEYSESAREQRLQATHLLIDIPACSVCLISL